MTEVWVSAVTRCGAVGCSLILLEDSSSWASLMSSCGCWGCSLEPNSDLPLMLSEKESMFLLELRGLTVRPEEESLSRPNF